MTGMGVPWPVAWSPSLAAQARGELRNAFWRVFRTTESRWRWGTEFCTWRHGVIIYQISSTLPGPAVEVEATARTSQSRFLPQAKKDTVDK